MAAGADAANRRMKARGAVRWNKADYSHAAAVVKKLLSVKQS